MAIRLDASADYLSRTANLPASTAFTIAGWFRRRGAGGAAVEVLSGISRADLSSYYLAYVAGGTLYVEVNGAFTAAGAFSSDVWHFVALSSNGSGAGAAKIRRADVGATSLATTTRAGASFVSQLMVLCGVGDPNYYGNFAVAGVKVWDRELSDSELLSEMHRLTPASTTNLNLWTPMVHNSVANAVKDFSGNGRDWTANGSLTIEDGPPIGWGGSIIVPQYAAGGGGTTYNDSVSEGLTLGESQASALTAVATRSEGVTLGDSQAAARITAVTLGESLTLGDSLSAGLIYTDSLSEGVIVGADYAAAAVQAAALSEGLTLDAHHATAQTFVEALSEGVTLGDGLAPGLVLAATLAEAVTFGDNFASTVTKDETIAESVTLGDGFAATLAAVGAVSEGLTFGADLLAAATYPAALLEGVTLGVPLVDEHIQGGVYNDTLGETLALDASFSTTLVAGAVLAEGIVLDASFYTPPLGQSVRSGGGGGGGRAWGWELDREVEEEMGALLEGPPLTPATIEAVARRLDAPTESRIIGLKQPPIPAVSFDAAMVRRRRIRRRLLLLL